MENQKIITSERPTLLSWSILLLLSLVWGSSYILIKKSLVAFTPMQVGCLRLSISALAFLPIFLWHFKQIDWSKLKYLLIVGLCGSGLPAVLFPLAQTEISSSVAGTLSSLTPLFTLIIGALFFNAAAAWSKLTGILVGLMGAVFLIAFGQNAGLKGNLWYGIFILIGCVCYAFSTNIVKEHLQEMRSYKISAVAFFIVGIPCLIYLLTTNIVDVIQTDEHGWTSLGTVTVLALGGTLLATVLFFKLVQLTNPLFASLVSYLIPMIAMLLGAFDGESITILHFLGMGLVLLGVYLTKGK
ncbi:MAG: DMT family transporter [Saprospiraceae bacterium]